MLTEETLGDDESEPGAVARIFLSANTVGLSAKAAGSPEDSALGFPLRAESAAKGETMLGLFCVEPLLASARDVSRRRQQHLFPAAA